MSGEQTGEKLESLISEKNMAAALGVSKSTLLQFRAKGLPYLRIGGRVFYQEEEFVAWVKVNCYRQADSEETGRGKKKTKSDKQS